MDQKKYYKTKEMVKNYPALFGTMEILRHYIRQNKGNIKQNIIKLGGKMLFDVEKFNAWLETQTMDKEKKCDPEKK